MQRNDEPDNAFSAFFWYFLKHRIYELWHTCTRHVGFSVTAYSDSLPQYWSFSRGIYGFSSNNINKQTIFVEEIRRMLNEPRTRSGQILGCPKSPEISTRCSIAVIYGLCYCVPNATQKRSEHKSITQNFIRNLKCGNRKI